MESPSPFGLLPLPVWTRVLATAPSDVAWIRLRGLNSAFRRLVDGRIKRRFREEVTVEVHTFPNTDLSLACPNQRRRGATVNLCGNLVYLEDLPLALNTILHFARPKRLSLRSLASLHLTNHHTHTYALSRAEHEDLRETILGVVEAVAGCGTSGDLPFTHLTLDGFFGGEEFAASLAAGAGRRLRKLRFSFPYNPHAMETLPYALPMMEVLECLSVSDEGCHEDEFMQNHCLSPVLRNLPPSLKHLTLGGSISNAMVNLADIEVIPETTRLTSLRLPKCYQLGPLLQEYKTARSRSLSSLTFLEGPISSGFLSGGDSDLLLFTTLPSLRVLVNTNDEDTPPEIADMITNTLDYHHSEPNKRDMVLKWPAVTEELEPSFIFQKVFADFHVGGPFEGMKLCQATVKGTPWAREVGDFDAAFLFTVKDLSLLICLNQRPREFAAFDL